MTENLKPSPTSGSKGSASKKKQSSAGEPGGPVRPESLAADGGVASGIVRLKSLTVGGDNPGTGMWIPPAGQIFEADAERGKALVACGLAEVAPEGAKGE